MNKILPCLLLIFFFTSFCKPEDNEFGNYQIQATIYFLNETSDSIKSLEGCQRDIAAGQTLTLNLNDIVLGEKPGVDDFPVSVFSNCVMMYKDGNTLKCEYGIENIENYENRREIKPMVFEFTFRFTEAKKADAEACF